jgi:hypothetical protein
MKCQKKYAVPPLLAVQCWCETEFVTAPPGVTADTPYPGPTFSKIAIQQSPTAQTDQPGEFSRLIAAWKDMGEP